MVPNKNGHANHGHSCVKGRFAIGYATHSESMKETFWLADTLESKPRF